MIEYRTEQDSVSNRRGSSFVAILFRRDPESENAARVSRTRGNSLIAKHIDRFYKTQPLFHHERQSAVRGCGARSADNGQGVSAGPARSSFPSLLKSAVTAGDCNDDWKLVAA